MTRFDYGTWLLLMHYAECWTQERGPACLVLFTPNSHLQAALAKWICPNVEVIAFNNWFSRTIFRIFRRELVQYLTLNPIYAYACCRWPHALFLFDMTFCRKKPENISCYVPAFDPVLQNPAPFSNDFLDTYIFVRKGYDYRKSIYQDATRLFYRSDRNKADRKDRKNARPSKQLLESLNIENHYAVINLNCKDYRNTLRNNRRINHPERYNGLIDFLIAKGYSVVVQGREEQPLFAPRKGLFDYSKSAFVSAENDYHLFSGCAFAIFPKTGPEVFGPICNIPVLGLNYTELAAIVPKSRCRFFPKHVFDRKKDRLIHWEELLKRPCFFDVGILSFETGIEYLEMDEEELVEAADEFLKLLPLPHADWLRYTKKQQEFKQALHPVHIDLFDVDEVPCDVYLNSKKYK